MRRSLTAVSLAGGLLLSACTSIDPEIRAAEPLVCPEGSDCYDPAIPVGPGGVVALKSGDLFFETLGGERTTATESIALDPVNEGPVTFILENIGAAEHNIRIDQAAGDDKLVQASGGETAEGILLLYAGDYTFYCDIPGHRGAGMEGVIEILPALADVNDGQEGEPAADEAPSEEAPEPDNAPTPEIDETDQPEEPAPDETETE